jgi:hypothetical protein
MIIELFHPDLARQRFHWRQLLKTHLLLKLLPLLITDKKRDTRQIIWVSLRFFYLMSTLALSNASPAAVMTA